MSVSGGAAGTWQAGTERAVVCKHWLRGLCKKGDGCGFLHGYDVTKRPECYFHAKFGKCWTTGPGVLPPRCPSGLASSCHPNVCGEKRLCHLAGPRAPRPNLCAPQHLNHPNCDFLVLFLLCLAQGSLVPPSVPPLDPTGECSIKDCPFLHVDTTVDNSRACPWYDRGFCRNGEGPDTGTNWCEWELPVCPAAGMDGARTG
ncbi:putative cleavage and polyadenylation specificity factor subunit 4-like protein [Aix galericulata]|nr:putative cleavage and polyadenylation specificity factor subunit 4-like protein [Aix galericulata]